MNTDSGGGVAASRGEPYHPGVAVEKCPCCKRRRFRTFTETQHLGVDLRYLLCVFCGLVFMSPRLSDEDLAEFYADHYRVLYEGDCSPTAENLADQKNRAAHLARRVESEVDRVRSHLDIGCSAGELLGQVHRVFPDALSVGVEPARGHRQWCVEQGLEVFSSLAEVGAGYTDRFDLISLSHVLEHLGDPVEYLERLRREFLNAEGHLLIEVPNLFGHSSFEVAHLVCFHERTLRSVLESAGFKVGALIMHSIPRGQRSRPGSRLRLGQRYITVLATPSCTAGAGKSQVKKVWWPTVRWRRFQGMTGRTIPQLVMRVPAKISNGLARSLGLGGGK